MRALEGLDGGADLAQAALRFGEKEQQLRIVTTSGQPFLQHAERAPEVAFVEVRAREEEERREVVGTLAQRAREQGARLLVRAEPGKAETLILLCELTPHATLTALAAPAEQRVAALARQREGERHAGADQEGRQQHQRQRRLPLRGA